MTGEKSGRRISEKNIDIESAQSKEVSIPLVSVPLRENNSRRLFIKTFRYAAKIGVLFFLIASSFYLKSFSQSHSLGAFSLSDLTADILDRVSSQGLFIEPVKNVSKESPEMAIIEENSVRAVFPPVFIKAQVLGNIIEEQEPERTGIIEYAVSPDDTISSIAEKFNISVNTIMWANDLTGKAVKPGQELLILPVSGVLYMVKEGDTLGVIADNYKVKSNEIIVFNDLKSEEDIYIGDVLVIPGGKIVPKALKIEPIPFADSYFIIPTAGIISQGSHGVNGAAVDISNSCGKSVVASAGGKVLRSGWIPVGGNVITVLHPNGVVTYYGHLSAMTVVPGQIVAAGEVIGYVGNTGYTVGATGCHLHFETRGARNFMARYSRGTSVGWQ